MVRRLDSINTTNWQLALGRPGDVVEDLDDVDQSIRIILATPKGSVPQRPLFGSDLREFLDYPLNEAAPHMVRESFEAIALWEPRAEVLRVTPSNDEAGITLAVEWKPAGTNAEARLTEVRL